MVVLSRNCLRISIWGQRLARFIDGLSKEDFSADELRQAGAAKCIEAIGEASGEILRRYEHFALRYPQLELAQAYRARNRLSHGYDSIDWEILWDTATMYVPCLIVDVRQLLSEDDEQ